MPQNIQKRLLKYVLQQLALFSEIDLPNLDVSLGTNSRISLTNLELDIERFSIPGIYVRSGSIRETELVLTMGDGVNINCTGLEMTITPSATTGTNKSDSEHEFSLAKSTADLANSVMFNDMVDELDDTVSSDSSIRTEQTQKNDTDDPKKTEQTTDAQHGLSGVMSRAVDMALSRLRHGLHQ
ncbi:unnamed protein product [Ambrosiozyma monospora]|uniref:Unnamed protein product n=1 Tax=Ambrosiozyma monospora TaxID=43982 RepID=A0ACB5T3X5_AMBMO|nr:unnamed protein product [Ambrosiozyma monospora]